MQTLLDRHATPLADEARSNAAGATRMNRLTATRAARRNARATVTKFLALAALSLAALGGLSACNGQTVSSHANGIAQKITPFDNFGEILKPKK